MTAQTASAPLQPCMNLTDRTVLVTGAGRGLGRAAAIALAEAGADVALLSRTREDLDDVAAVVAARGRRPYVLPCDVTDVAAVAAAVNSLPGLDALVAGAGTNVPRPMLEVDEATYDRIMDLNVRAAYFCVQHAARRMQADGIAGSIVLLSSQMGHVGAPRRTVYCASKHAIEGLTKAMAVELAPYGIRVNAVAPTYVRTPMTAPFLADETFRADALAAIPLGRFGEVDDVAGSVVFLCSTAAGLITGHSLVIDGGYTAQ